MEEVRHWVSIAGERDTGRCGGCLPGARSSWGVERPPPPHSFPVEHLVLLEYPCGPRHCLLYHPVELRT